MPPGSGHGRLRGRGRVRSRPPALAALTAACCVADQGIDRVLLRLPATPAVPARQRPLGSPTPAPGEVVARRGGRASTRPRLAARRCKDVGALHGALRVIGEQHGLHRRPAPPDSYAPAAMPSTRAWLESTVRCCASPPRRAEPSTGAAPPRVGPATASYFSTKISALSVSACNCSWAVAAVTAGSACAASGGYAAPRWQLRAGQGGEHEPRPARRGAGQASQTGYSERRTRGDATWAISFFLGADRVS